MEKHTFVCDNCGYEAQDHSWWKSLSDLMPGPLDLCPQCVLIAYRALRRALPNLPAADWPLENAKAFIRHRTDSF